MSKYHISDIAKRAGIHPNTVRCYERAGLVSPVPRAENGYRIFSERHLVQVLVLRCIFSTEWPGERIRRASFRIVYAIKSWDLETARAAISAYMDIINDEYDKACEAINILKEWEAQPLEHVGLVTYSRNEAAAMIGTTPEALRNWERNDLITVPRSGRNRKRHYGEGEMKRLRVIYQLRQSKYSMSAIHRSLKALDLGCVEEAVRKLQNPKIDEVISMGDHRLAVLTKTANQAEKIMALLDKAEH